MELNNRMSWEEIIEALNSGRESPLYKLNEISVLKRDADEWVFYCSREYSKSKFIRYIQ